MKTKAQYKNHHHYIREGWSQEPKESFKELAAHIQQHCGAPRGSLLDVGCATGELLGFLQGRFGQLSFTGVDVFDELLEAGRDLLPAVNFVRASALNLSPDWNGAFDLVTATGVMSIFSETEIERFWRNLLTVTRPGGTVFVLAPLNEYGVDTMIRHRKRMSGECGEWEAGWNVFAMETVREIIAGMGQSCEFIRFRPDLLLTPREDPVRTWTMRTERNHRQLTNGLKLLIDHYFIIVKTT